MNDRLFINLKKYRPRDGHTPLENFITEAFAWILNYNEDFSLFFFKKIMDEVKLKIPKNNDYLEWETQVNFGGYFPDMVLHYGQKKALVFEHKAWSKLHPDQLDNYRKYVEKEKYKEYRIILITATEAQHEQNPDKPWCWSEIVEWINEYQNKNTPTLFLSNFIALLKSEGMGPLDLISQESIRLYNLTKHFEKNTLALFAKVNQRLIAKFSNSNLAKTLKVYHEWERIGLGNGGKDATEWIPGLFFGVILNSERHGTPPSSSDTGNNFVIMLTFNEVLHKQYPKNEYYKELAKDLESLTVELGEGWNFSHNIKESFGIKRNFYHPIQIQKPFMHLLEGTETTKEQEDVIFELIKDILPEITSLESFKQLRSIHL